ncbi:hypothetical protein F2Q69_00060473 [Brassica cretica]|uniref:Uncharacterized protein n=1 Tax=Brassica cretica TaxID=69181 RepID=A0A8S9REU4_BRACR|nr:hypothetical protein F2Q69_00060473 [Brassica cretica]
MQGEDLYLPTAPSMLVKGNPDRQWNTPSVSCQSPYITFDVVDRDGNQNDLKPQACIFKVGDDCRQDILALQVISLLRDIYTTHSYFIVILYVPEILDPCNMDMDIFHSNK